VDCDGILHITHDEINHKNFIADCWTGLGVANGQIFDFPMELLRRPYNPVCHTTEYVLSCWQLLIVRKNQWRNWTGLVETDIWFARSESERLRVEEEKLMTYLSKAAEGVLGKHGLCCRRVSVGLALAGIVSKRLNLSWNCFDHLAAPSF